MLNIEKQTQKIKEIRCVEYDLLKEINDLAVQEFIYSDLIKKHNICKVIYGGYKGTIKAFPRHNFGYHENLLFIRDINKLINDNLDIEIDETNIIHANDYIENYNNPIIYNFDDNGKLL